MNRTLKSWQAKTSSWNTTWVSTRPFTTRAPVTLKTSRKWRKRLIVWLKIDLLRASNWVTSSEMTKSCACRWLGCSFHRPLLTTTVRTSSSRPTDQNRKTHCLIRQRLLIINGQIGLTSNFRVATAGSQPLSPWCSWAVMAVMKQKRRGVQMALLYQPTYALLATTETS